MSHRELLKHIARFETTENILKNKFQE